MADKEKKNSSNKKPKPSPYRFYVNREMSWLELSEQLEQKQHDFDELISGNKNVKL